MKSPMFTKYTFKLNYSTRALQPRLQKQGENIKNKYLSQYLEIEMYRLRYMWILRYIYWDVFGYWGTYIEMYLDMEVHILRCIWILRYIYWDVFGYWGTYIEIYLDIEVHILRYIWILIKCEISNCNVPVKCNSVLFLQCR